MSDYEISKVYESDVNTNRLINDLLIQEGIRRDGHLDYTCAMYDNDMNVIATGSCFGNTLRCMAVDHHHQGENLMNEIVTHLIQYQYSKSNVHLFLYTKCNSAKFFGSLGFYEIARVDNQLVFMENRKNGFRDYISKLQKNVSVQEKDIKENSLYSNKASVSAIVMNANPFTLGHQYLVEQACVSSDLVHLFIVSEDASIVPFDVRKKLVIAGTSHLSNICYHDSGPYIISNATFPSYFQKDEKTVIEGHALLDLTIFSEIASVMHITNRFVGEESNSFVTSIYNEIMQRELPCKGIACTIIPRKKIGSSAISASTVRQTIKDENWELLGKLVPKSTLDFFQSDEAVPIIAKIRKESNVIHY